MSEAVSHRSPPPRRSMFFPPAEWTHPMPNLFWQRWAPITALSLVALAAALIFWMQPDESSPVAIVDPAPLAVAAPGPVSTTAADRDTHDAECRSTTCRIRITYRDEMDAQMGEIFLLGDIAGTLPSANFGRLAGAGGTVQLVMYADTGARPSRP